ncbi:apolipoprotein Da, duplicate 1 [Entelurus aequoreus]|uniref:apolipoprotein Da, duplicate 1 n=1 Tax=Entelurus aequoreus TaxID=161455 RepID=UPI002B1D1344|nr:apolipoprotein Da, duplicate 1 [Entelurus aequoreus]
MTLRRHFGSDLTLCSILAFIQADCEVLKANLTMAISLMLVAFIVPLVGAQVPHWGSCPEPDVQASFDVKPFMGRWFEIGRLPTQFEKGCCMETNFTFRTNNSFRVVSSQMLKGSLRKIEGTGVVEDQKHPAKLGISFSYVLPYSPYWILSTDYVNTALVYSCTDVLRVFHLEFAWILARTRTLPESAVEKAKETFASKNIDVSRMIATKQTGCDE